MKSWHNFFSGCRVAQARRKAIRTFKGRLRAFLLIFQHQRKQLRQEKASTLLAYFPKKKRSTPEPVPKRAQSGLRPTGPRPGGKAQPQTDPSPPPKKKRRSGRVEARGMTGRIKKKCAGGGGEKERKKEGKKKGRRRRKSAAKAGGAGEKRKGNLSVPSPVPSKQVRRRLNVVPAERVELSRPYGHCALNTACLPIPPCRQAAWL